MVPLYPCVFKSSPLRRSKINEMVQVDSSSFATVEITSPVRWNNSTNLCTAWFNIDGIYNGIRYRAYYFGVVSSFRNSLRSLFAVYHQSFAVGSQAFRVFSVESTVIVRRILPLICFELQSVIEEIFAFYELSTVPFGYIATLVRNN